MRNISREFIRTRSGVCQIRVERRAIERQEACGDVVAVPAGRVVAKARSLADDVEKRLRNRIAFPSEFWKGAVE